MLDYEWATMHRSMYLRKERAYSYNVATFYLVSRGTKLQGKFSVSCFLALSPVSTNTQTKRTQKHIIVITDK